MILKILRVSYLEFWQKLPTNKNLFTIPAFCLLFCLKGFSQPSSAFPVDIAASIAPQPVMANGRIRLAYELHIINYSAKTIELKGLDVFNNSATPLFSYSGEALEKLLKEVGPADSTGMVHVIAGGRSIVVFLDLTMDSGVPAPAILLHQLSFSISDKDGRVIDKKVKGPAVIVQQEQVVVISPPLKGNGWVAFNGLFNPDHRRTILTIDGKAVIAQRFAIDWQQLGPDETAYHGDPKLNPSYYGYGAEVLAVANGRITAIKDSLLENAGSNGQGSRLVTLETIAGNYIILDIGGGHFAFYAHLQPGSLKIKPGDLVKTGQVLALLGNTGNSDAPHLHFQLMNANSALGSEGIPYELNLFKQSGIIDDPDAVDAGKSWKPKNKKSDFLHNEFPVDNAVVGFP